MVGQPSAPNRCQITWFASLATGCRILYSRTLSRMFSVSFSASNLGEWTPITTTWFLYFFSSAARWGRTWWQLTQQYVQKSSRTTFPRSFSRWMGPSELIQPTAPSSDGRMSCRDVERGPGAGSEAVDRTFSDET